MLGFTIRQDAGNYLTVSVIAKVFPSAWDTWDGNQIRIRVEYAVSGETDAYSATLFTTDLESFRDELVGDVVDESGLIALTTMDGVVYVEMERRGRHFVTGCNLRKVPDGVVDEHLELRVPVSAAAGIVRELDTILATYPVIQAPEWAEPGDLTPPSSN